MEGSLIFVNFILSLMVSTIIIICLIAIGLGFFRIFSSICFPLKQEETFKDIEQTEKHEDLTEIELS